MTDLVIAWIVLAVEAVACFFLAFLVSEKWNDRSISTASATCVTVLLIYAFGLHGAVLWARVMPFSNVILLSNLAPAILGVLAGVAIRHKGIASWRKGLSLVIFVAIAVFAAIQPVIRTIPRTNGHWRDGVCIQTSDASCSACCAATLLHDAGIKASEAEMADLCLTSTKGTTMLGLYRGLKLKTRGTNQRVYTLLGDVDDLRANTHWPIAMSVGLPPNADVDPIYEEQWGWTPGHRHAVVMYGFAENGRIDIGDPSIGREQWTVDDLEVLFRGSAFYLSEE